MSYTQYLQESIVAQSNECSALKQSAKVIENVTLGSNDALAAIKCDLEC